jgi:hypothetical protein
MNANAGGGLRFCDQCGGRLSNAALFCTHCGAKQPAETSGGVPPLVPPPIPYGPNQSPPPIPPHPTTPVHLLPSGELTSAARLSKPQVKSGFPWLKVVVGVIAISIVVAVAMQSYDIYRGGTPTEVSPVEANGENPATGSEQAADASNQDSSGEMVQAESAYEDSGSQECIAVSRKYVAMQRRYDAGTLPAFDIAEMAQLQNFRGVLFGCKGGESREEKEYLAQHPVKAEAEAVSAPKSERERAFAELLSMWGVAGAGWGESSFVVKAKSTVQDPVHQLCPKLMRVAESVEMGVSLEYSNESGESISANCPTQAEQIELDAEKVVADEQRVIAERDARDQARREDACASLKLEYESRVQSVLDESKGRSSPTVRLKQLEELYGDSLHGCANHNRLEPASSNPSLELGS